MGLKCNCTKSAYDVQLFINIHTNVNLILRHIIWDFRLDAFYIFNQSTCCPIFEKQRTLKHAYYINKLQRKKEHASKT